jgi:hypothetical protein
VAKGPFSNADARPRIHFRLRNDVAQVAGNPSGPWSPTTDLLDAIDAIAGEGAHERPAVIIWEGTR